MSDSYPFGALAPMPRNPARMPQGVEDTAKAMTVDPFMDAYKAVTGRMTPDEQQNFAMMAGLGILSPMARGVKPVTQGIRGFHASPHDFAPEPGFPLGRFDINKVGTGQGAQSYGHGIYIAENPAVSGRGGQYDLEFSRGLYSTGSGKQIQPGEAFQQLYEATPSNLHPDHRRAVVRSVLEGLDEKGSVAKYLRSIEPPAMHRDAYATAGAKAEELGLGPGKAHIYEVNINAKPEQFLDWDKPLSGQGEQVRATLQQQIENAGGSPNYKGAKFLASPTKAGPDEYKALGSQIYSGLATDSQAGLSERLREAGIPGIKYLDQGSRVVDPPKDLLAKILDKRYEMDRIKREYEATPTKQLGDRHEQLRVETDALHQQIGEHTKAQQTSNYVLFDDKLIDILRKYGLAGAAPVAGAAGIGAAADSSPPFGSLAP